jgi:PAS domain S-box-containing protein
MPAPGALPFNRGNHMGQAEDIAADYLKRKRLLLAAATIAALLILAADLFSPVQGAVAVLYIVVVLLVAQTTSGGRMLLGAGLACAVLSLVAFLVSHWGETPDSAYMRLGVSLIAIFAATLLSIRNQTARTTLAEQARILELGHDTVIIRDMDGVILYWNEGAEQLYGWHRHEALGRRCNDLLLCQYRPDEVTNALQLRGSWSGELTRTRRDGTEIVLASRWLLQRDPEGRSVGVIESSADVTEQLRADAERQRSERRYRTIFNAAGFAIWESNWSAAYRYIVDAAPADADLHAWLCAHPDIVREASAKAVIGEMNEAALAMFDAPARETIIGHSIVSRFALDTGAAFAEMLSALAGGVEMVEKETHFTTLAGRTIDLVLRVRMLGDGEPWSRILVMALDVTERNEARAKIEQASAELAHASRISTLGQLAASIAHEVNQPLSAIINYGKSGKRWLNRDVPEIAEVSNCLDHIVSNGSRAADVIARVRSLARKSAPEVEPLDMNELANEAVELVQREAQAARVSIQSACDEDAPAVVGDRVQIQQVLVNLVLNAIQAMRQVEERPRALAIQIEPDGTGMVRVAVQDSGPGIAGDPGRIFEPFFTTKSDGMGMGLSICRSIIEAQGGRIAATNNTDHGATVAFTLPAWAAAPTPPAIPGQMPVQTSV